MSVPASGSVYVDTQVLIYTVEQHAVYEPLLRPLWQAFHHQTIKVVTSELVWLEVMVRPLREANVALQTAYHQLFTQTRLELLPIDRAVLLEAAALRSGLSTLRAPDAIHAATAVVHPTVLLVTNDAVFAKLPGLSVTLLDAVLAS